MWKRIRRELLIEYYWWKRHSVKKWSLDSPLGIMGILLIIAGVIIMIIIGQAFATIFRSMIPVVGGNQVAGVYWSSISLAIKFSLALFIFFICIVVIIYLKFLRRKF